MAACVIDCRIKKREILSLSLLTRLMIAVVFMPYSKRLFLLAKKKKKKSKKLSVVDLNL